MTKEQLISKYYGAAISATKNTGIFPQTLFTQLILESGYNLSKLAKDYNNFFGIKATPNFNGKVISLNTYEYNPSKYLVVGTNLVYNNYFNAVSSGANKMSLFRVYATPKDGFKDYVKFLQTNPRYKKVFAATTAEKQFEELQSAGYATSSTYANDLKNIYNSIKDYLPRVAIATGGIALFGLLSFFLYTQIKK
jgi:flagellum-specific peptidoglycan hydrolase FlgJ